MKLILAFSGLLIVGAILALISALAVVVLWNWLVPSIFGFRAIRLLEAWGLCWLRAALFKTTVKSE